MTNIFFYIFLHMVQNFKPHLWRTSHIWKWSAPPSWVPSVWSLVKKGHHVSVTGQMWQHTKKKKTLVFGKKLFVSNWGNKWLKYIFKHCGNLQNTHLMSIFLPCLTPWVWLRVIQGERSWPWCRTPWPSSWRPSILWRSCCGAPFLKEWTPSAWRSTCPMRTFR